MASIFALMVETLSLSLTPCLSSFHGRLKRTTSLDKMLWSRFEMSIHRIWNTIACASQMHTVLTN